MKGENVSYWYTYWNNNGTTLFTFWNNGSITDINGDNIGHFFSARITCYDNGNIHNADNGLLVYRVNFSDGSLFCLQPFVAVDVER